MNSAGPPHTQPAGPFGYDFFPAEHVPDHKPLPPQAQAQSHQAATQGPTLLNSVEEDYMNNFFMSHSANDGMGHNFELALQQAHEQLHGPNMSQYGWLMNEPPPNFMGASANPKHAPNQFQVMPQHQAFDFGAFHDGTDMMGNHQHMLGQASLMQHTNMQHAQSMHMHTPSLVSAPSTEASDMMHTTDALTGMVHPSSSLMVLPSTTITANEARELMAPNPLSALAPINTMHHDLQYDGPHTAPARMDDATDGRLYRFGSDSHFGTDGFKPSSQNERHDIIAQRLTEELHMLKPINRSTNPTRASSPVSRMHEATKRNAAQLEAERINGQHYDDTSHISNPKKRRRDSAEDEATSGPSPAFKRKFSMPNPRLRRVSSTVDEPNLSLSPTATSASKRRRSSVSAQKQIARENLTEEQKRSNHIQSEQKRRNLIKLGFDELRRIVPELRGGGLSKSMELMEVSNFLDLVIETNKSLRARLGIAQPG